LLEGDDLTISFFDVMNWCRCLTHKNR
jgi:hypothetical protein